MSLNLGLTLLLLSGAPGVVQGSTADPCVSSQSERPTDPPERVQFPTDPPAEAQPEPRSDETQNLSEPSISAAVADNRGGQSQTRAQDPGVASGPDSETRIGDHAGEEVVQLRPEDQGTKEDSNKLNGDEESEEMTPVESRTTKHNDDPDSGPNKPAKSRTISAGKVWVVYLTV